MSNFLQDQDVVLFTGDSVTDSGRSRTDDNDLGGGYAGMIAAWYSARHPAQRVRFLNRGTGGNRIRDLRARWQSDCIDLRPNVVSILIGINDTWRRFDQNEITPVEDYERDFRDMLERAVKIGARLVLCEPFVLPVPADRRAWRSDLDPRIQVVRRLAVEYGTLLVPLDGRFAQAAARRDPAFWLPDGVHPSPAGHALIAQEWLRAVEENG